MSNRINLVASALCDSVAQILGCPKGVACRGATLRCLNSDAAARDELRTMMPKGQDSAFVHCLDLDTCMPASQSVALHCIHPFICPALCFSLTCCACRLLRALNKVELLPGDGPGRPAR